MLFTSRVSLMSELAQKSGYQDPLGKTDPAKKAELKAAAKRWHTSYRTFDKNKDWSQDYMDISQIVPEGGYQPVTLYCRRTNMMNNAMMHVRKDLTKAQIMKRPRYTIDPSIGAKVEEFFREHVRPRQTLLESESMALSQLKKAAGISRTLARLPLLDKQSDQVWRTLDGQIQEGNLKKSNVGHPGVPISNNYSSGTGHFYQPSPQQPGNAPTIHMPRRDVPYEPPVDRLDPIAEEDEGGPDYLSMYNIYDDEGQAANDTFIEPPPTVNQAIQEEQLQQKQNQEMQDVSGEYQLANDERVPNAMDTNVQVPGQSSSNEDEEMKAIQEMMGIGQGDIEYRKQVDGHDPLDHGKTSDIEAPGMSRLDPNFIKNGPLSILDDVNKSIGQRDSNVPPTLNDGASGNLMTPSQMHNEPRFNDMKDQMYQESKDLNNKLMDYQLAKVKDDMKRMNEMVSGVKQTTDYSDPKDAFFKTPQEIEEAERQLKQQ